MALFPILTSDGFPILSSDGFAILCEGGIAPSAGTPQVIMGKTYGGQGGDSPVYCALRGSEWSNVILTPAPADQLAYSHPWSVPGTFKNLYCEVSCPQNYNGLTWPDTTFEIMLGTSVASVTSTGLTVTVAAGSGGAGVEALVSAQNTTSTFHINRGERVVMQRIGSSTIAQNSQGAHYAWSCTFLPDTDGQSSYGTNQRRGSSAPLNAGQTACAPLNGQDPSWEVANWNTAVYNHSIVPLSCGTILVDIILSAAPGAATRHFVCVKNGVTQDGSGGTVDTRMDMTGATTQDAWTFNSLSFVPQDTWTVYSLASTGSPAAAYALISVGLTASTLGQYALCFDTLTASPDNTGATDFAAGQGSGWAQSTAQAPVPPYSGPRWPVPESFIALPAGIDSFQLTGFIVESATISAGGTVTYTTRQNLTTQVGAQTVTVTPSPSTVIDSSHSSLPFTSPANRLDLMAVAGGTLPLGAGNHVNWTWLVASASPVITATTYAVRRLRRFMLPWGQGFRQFISRVELIPQTGVGLNDGQGSDPIVMFRLSRDGGQTWGYELQMSVGKMGAYLQRWYLYQLGDSRNPVIELTCSDPVFVAWLAFLVDIETGTN